MVSDVLSFIIRHSLLDGSIETFAERNSFHKLTNKIDTKFTTIFHT